MTLVRHCDGCQEAIEASDLGNCTAVIRDEEMDFCGKCAPFVENYRKACDDLYDEMMGMLDARERALNDEFWAFMRARAENGVEDQGPTAEQG